MHTFSPAKSWILGLQEYKKPLCHLHTQYLQEIPYDTIDMDYMNEHQSAHGDREYGHIVTRMGIERKVIMGYWKDEKVLGRIASWMRTAVGVMESSHIRIMRIADNMRNVAVTEGDKVEAQIKFGWEVDAYPVNEICKAVDAVTDAEVKALTDEYYDTYKILLEGRDADEFRRHVEAQAKIEIGFERFLKEKDYQAIVTHFGDLGSLQQLPGLAIQRLMQNAVNAADGFGSQRLSASRRMEQLIVKLLNAGRCQFVQTVFPQMWKNVQGNILPIEVSRGCFDAFQVLFLPCFQPCLQKGRIGPNLFCWFHPATAHLAQDLFARRARERFCDLLLCDRIIGERQAPFPILVN